MCIRLGDECVEGIGYGLVNGMGLEGCLSLRYRRGCLMGSLKVGGV